VLVVISRTTLLVSADSLKLFFCCCCSLSDWGFYVVQGGEPATIIKDNSFDELVLFQSAQALPLFIVKIKQ